jgi:Tol biopolymer transport system component
MVRGGVLVVGQPARVTDRDGYDNQPSFAPDGGSLLYTSIREDGQADIYRYDIASGLTSRVTQTAESEYSATSLPDGSGISVVRVEADSTQRLWRFGWEGGKPELLLSAVRPVGYHAWADEFTLGLFVLGTPATLQLADLRTGEAEIVVEGIGRSLHRVPGRRAISFLRRDGEGDRWIEEIDVANRAIRRLVQPRGRGEDYAWTPDGRIVMAEGSKLFIWDPAKGGEWQELADLAGTGIREVTRLAISAAGDRLALVAAR